MKTPPSPSDNYASASEVARLAYCERQISLDLRFGPQSTEVQDRRRDQGNIAHAAFHRDARLAGHPRDYANQKPWCFVACLAFGQDAPQTRALRAFRDNVLRPHGAGRALIRWYYKLSPAICDALRSRPLVLALCRAALALLVVPVADALARAAGRRRGRKAISP